MANGTDICFPTPFSIYVQLNVYNMALPAKFLITDWWSSFPTLEIILYVFGGTQIALSLLGIYMAVGRTVDPKRGLPTYVYRKVIVFFNSAWLLFLGGLVVFLPTQWLSNITMGMILLHSWSEFFGLVLRFMIVNNSLNQHSYNLFWKWAVIAVSVSAIPYILTFNPYIEGFITIVFVLPADFLNLFVAPILSIKWIKQHPHTSAAEKSSEILIGLLNVVHVLFFYGQGIISCLVSVEAGALYFTVLQIISTLVFLGAIISYALTIRKESEWEGPLKKIYYLFDCAGEGKDSSDYLTVAVETLNNSV